MDILILLTVRGENKRRIIFSVYHGNATIGQHYNNAIDVLIRLLFVQGLYI